MLGMQSFDKTEAKAIAKSDLNIAKNFLKEDEIKLLGLLVEQYLAFAETMAQQQTPMYMHDWIARLDSILQLNGRNCLPMQAKSVMNQLFKNRHWNTINLRQHKSCSKTNKALKRLRKI
jgi:hypothetical protein